MELIAKQIDAYQANFSEQAFMVGMLSLADVVMQISAEEVFQQIRLSEEIELAVLKHEGRLGQLLTLALKIENADFEAAESDIEALGITASDLLAIQLETMQWANQMTI